MQVNAFHQTSSAKILEMPRYDIEPKSDPIRLEITEPFAVVAILCFPSFFFVLIYMFAIQFSVT